MASLRVRKKLLLVVASGLGYALLFALLYPVLGGPTQALATVPVGLTGWLFGTRAGVLAGLLALPYNILVVLLFLPDTSREVIQLNDVLINLTIHPLVGFGFGYVSNLNALVKKQNRELEHMAFHDALTGLPNRALFEDRFEHALARSVREQK